MKMPGLAWSRSVTGLLAAYWLALATVTHIPQRAQASTSQADDFPYYIAHQILYAGLAFLLSWAWTTRRPFFPRGLLFAFVVAIVYAVIDELAQLMVPGRYADVYDWFADAFGAAVGGCLFWGANTYYRARCRAAKEW